MKKILMLLFVAILLGSCVTYEKQTKEGAYIIYEYGAYFDAGDSCTRVMNRKYGFQTAWGTCMPSKRTLSINEENELLLEKKNGKNWRENYKEELQKCRGSK